MGTQGLVTVTAYGEVVLKAVAGCNGFEAGKLAEAIRSGDIAADIESVYNEARQLGFGCEDCLVVWDAEDRAGAAVQEGLPPLYRETFSDPQFNPRWEHGTAAYVEIVETEGLSDG